MKAIQAEGTRNETRQHRQQEIMKLFKDEEGSKPACPDCLPIFLQIPIFFALYKVLMLSIEICRHQPFTLLDQGSDVRPDP